MASLQIIDTSPPVFRSLRFDRIVGGRARSAATYLVSFGLFLAGVLLAVGYTFGGFIIPLTKILGLFIILFAARIVFISLGIFYASNLKPSRVLSRDGTTYNISVEAARIISRTRLLFAAPAVFEELFFAYSQILSSRLLLVRLDISQQAFDSMILAPRDLASIDGETFFTSILDRLDKKNEIIIRAADILEALQDFDPVWRQFLFDTKVKREDLAGAALWVEDEMDRAEAKNIWWRDENLSRLPGIGKDLGFGYTYTLDRYSHDLIYSTTRFEREARTDEIHAIEQVLSRSYEANVLLVGEEGAGKHAVLEGLATWIREGRVAPALEHKRVVVLDGASVVAAAKTKGAYEELVIKMFNEMAQAGNVILVLENLPGLIASSFSLGTDIMEIIESYIAGSAIQVVALSDGARFHRDLEPNGKIMKLFEKVEIAEPSPERVLRMMEDAVSLIEPASGKLFTYQALLRARELADRFIALGAMPEKAIDLLDEAASAGESTIITPADIDAIVEKRTHIPTGAAEAQEKQKLLHMEELLHERMIDQEEAVRVVADALRRARSGLKGGTRPIGSFLFLGPTGVGKTETAKALAEVYFGDKDAMIRFDMSEYQDAEGIEKLTGSYDSKQPGILSSRLRERPFSLLLFDEFEKAARPVHNLFLQILDEGFFSDGGGKRVSSREAMIIATSNAGANLIFDLIKAGKDPAEIQNNVVDTIRKDNIFSPELLNRFDAVVLYHPLSADNLAKVALLLLRELAQKLKEKEITFEPTGELATKVVEIGYDPAFGARPMRRAIAARVEQVIAKKILAGQLNRGDTFSFSKEEIERL